MAKWTVDQNHSAIGFEVKHMMVSKVKGEFESYTADVEAADLTDLTTASIAFKIDVASIHTRNEDRDNHLKSADFFDVENYPTIDFKSTNITKDGDDYKVTGDLTIKDATKPVTFNVEFGGKGTNPWGVEVYGFEAETKINREEFGLTWNAALETGGVLVGKDIKIKVELEMNPAA
ncbi:YceI family protein [Mesobacillus jeotgali]|uniref:YceI family protein n=1 Tax=Mesobacillus jeotgali TaxID=129985 RepID=UPI001CFD3B26|nr:YceI family protein [Mesobacillus jeotgali]